MSPVVHPHVACGAFGMCPLVGTRYKKKAANYDLCQADFEFDQLSEEGQAAYIKIDSPQQAWRSTRTQCCHHSASKLKTPARFVENVNIPENTEILPLRHTIQEDLAAAQVWHQELAWQHKADSHWWG